jgi:hypothetical protein
MVCAHTNYNLDLIKTYFHDTEFEIIMKRIITLTLGAAMLMATAQLSAQTTPRMGLCEEATQASCPPCASLNPALQTLMNNNSDKTIFMAYQVWWPGFDQMYLDNEADIDARVGTYYGYQFAPQVKFQGTYPNGGDGSLNTLTQTVINNNYAQMSEFNLTISAELVNGNLLVTGSLDATAAVSGNLKLHLVLTEGTIYSTQATGGTNGETEFHHVMKKFLPGVAGIDLADSWVAGESLTIDESYNLGGLTIYNWDDLEVIAFVQNNDDKFILQATKDSEVPIIVDAANNASAGNISGTPLVVCAGQNTLSPNVTIGNGGNETLTSCDIVYSVNGGAEQTYSWTGSLATLATALVTLDPITFTASAVDPTVINVMVQNPNGMMDEVSTDDMSSISIDPAPGTDYTVQVTIVADNYGDEIYWQITNSADVIVASGGNPNVGLDNVGTGVFPPPFSAQSYANGSTNVIDVTLPAIDCYTFHITDYYGDGLLGTGTYSLKDNAGLVMHSDVENYTDEAIKNFSGDATSAVSENLLSQGLTMSPNPVSENLNVYFNLVSQSQVNITVVNTLGQEVINEFLGARAMGMNNTAIDMSNLEAGIYYVSVVAGSELAMRKISVIR